MSTEKILAAHLGIDADDVTEASYGENMYDAGGLGEYLVLSDSEADDAAREYIEDSLWAFRPGFLVSYVGEGIDTDIIARLQERCEDANQAVRRLVGDRLDEMVEDAISADGRGHFLSGYDGEEVELEGDRYAYRVN